MSHLFDLVETGFSAVYMYSSRAYAYLFVANFIRLKKKEFSILSIKFKLVNFTEECHIILMANLRCSVKG